MTRPNEISPFHMARMSPKYPFQLGLPLSGRLLGGQRVHPILAPVDGVAWLLTLDVTICRNVWRTSTSPAASAMTCSTGLGQSHLLAEMGLLFCVVMVAAFEVKRLHRLTDAGPAGPRTQHGPSLSRRFREGIATQRAA